MRHEHSCMPYFIINLTLWRTFLKQFHYLKRLLKSQTSRASPNDQLYFYKCGRKFCIRSETLLSGTLYNKITNKKSKYEKTYKTEQTKAAKANEANEKQEVKKSPIGIMWMRKRLKSYTYLNQVERRTDVKLPDKQNIR